MSDPTLSESTQPAENADVADELLFVPDDENPALIDAQKTFAITVVSAIIFMGAIAVLIL